MRQGPSAWLFVALLAVACQGSGPEAAAAGGAAEGEGGSAGSAGGAGSGGGGAPASPRPGLHSLARVAVPPTSSGTAHLTELEPDGDTLWVSNSFDGVVALSTAGGGLALTQLPSTGPGVPRCTAIALHRPSRTLYCGALDGASLATYDAPPGGPATVRRLDALAASPLGLHVHGDTLLIAAGAGGLLAAPLAGDGTPGAPVRLPGTGFVRAVDSGNDTVVALDRDRGLLVLDAAGGSFTLRGELALDGPAIGLRLGGSRAAVALGSAGVAVIDVATAPSLLALLQPPCAAVSADVDGDRLAVGCASRTLLYDLGATPPRLSGHAAAEMSLLDLAFVAGDLLVLDWRAVVRFAADPSGEVLSPVLPRGRFLRPGAPASVELQNPGTSPLLQELWLGRERLQRLELAPGRPAIVSVDGAAIAPWVDARGTATLEVRPVAGPELQPWERRIALATGGPGTVGRPPQGELFPPLAAAGLPTIPEPGVATYLVFFQADCALQWPQLLDLAWLHATGRVPGGARPELVFVDRAEPSAGPLVLERLGVPELGGVSLTGYLGAPADDIFRDRFALFDVPGADFPHDYRVASDGTVIAVERVYEGAFAR